MARLLAALVAAASLASAAPAAGAGGVQAACAPGAASCVEAPALQAESLLVQKSGQLERARAGLAKRAAASYESSASTGAEVAAYVRNFLQDAKNAANALKAGFLAVKAAVPLFSEGKPSEGLVALTSGLFDAVVFILPPNTTESPTFAKFRESAKQVAQMLPGAVQGVASSIALFVQEGDTTALVATCNEVIAAFGPLAMEYLPSEVIVEVGKYLGAVEDGLVSFGEAMDTYGTGNTTHAIQQLYFGLRAAVAELVPESWRTNENVAAVFEILDSTVSSLSSIVLRFQQRLVNSGACWKQFEERARVRAEQCPSDHWFDGLHWCFQKGTSAPMQVRSQYDVCLDAGSLWRGVRTQPCNRAAQKQQWFFNEATGQLKDAQGYCLEAAGQKLKLRSCQPGQQGQEWSASTEGPSLLESKTGACLAVSGASRLELAVCDTEAAAQQWTFSAAEAASLLEWSLGRKRPTQTVRATCDTQSEYADQQGPWCYGTCPEGTEISGSRCATKCGGAFPAKLPLMCGKTNQMMFKALKEMAAASMKAGSTAKELVAEFSEAGGLSTTINSLVELGLGFAMPMCPSF